MVNIQGRNSIDLVSKEKNIAENNQTRILVIHRDYEYIKLFETLILDIEKNAKIDIEFYTHNAYLKLAGELNHNLFYYQSVISDTDQISYDFIKSISDNFPTSNFLENIILTSDYNESLLVNGKEIKTLNIHAENYQYRLLKEELKNIIKHKKKGILYEQ